jgi:MFS transporter, MHS family, proline/betaine transporter
MMIKKNLSALSSCFGNIIEWYDFGLFSVFASLFSQIFFPEENSTVTTITTFSIFALGFFCRPIGALIFGYIGDKKGRVWSLQLSILMISLPTFLIGCLPTYQTIGIYAPLFLTLIRIWQGISLGGEFSGNIIYLCESAPKNSRATFTSLASAGANLGVLLAALVGIITTKFLSPLQLQSWGWRLPYLFSGVICIVIYYLRFNIQETAIFVHERQHKHLAENPIKTAFSLHRWQILRTSGLVCMGTTFYYFCFIYIPIYLAQNRHFNLTTITSLFSFLVAAMIFLVPFAGYISDQIGHRKMMIINACLIMLLILPGFYLIQTGNIYLIILAMACFTIASSLEQGTTSTAIVENFPFKARYTGVAFGYNLGNGILGGTVPLISAWLITKTHFPLSAAIYIAGCALITGIVAFFWIPRQVAPLEN